MTNSQFLYAYISRSQSHLHLNRSHTTPYTGNTLSHVLSLSCKNVQKTTYTIIYTIILYYYSMFFVWGYIYIFSNGSLFPRAGMCSTQTQTTKSKSSILHPFHKLCVILTQFTKNTQNHFGTHFDKTLIFPSKTKLSDNLKI